MEKSVGIMGGGNMGEALIAGIIQSGLLTPREILFHEPRPDRTKYLQESKDYKEILDTEKKRKNELEVMV